MESQKFTIIITIYDCKNWL